MSDKWHGGKGSKRRPEDRKAYEDNYDRIFRKKDETKSDGLSKKSDSETDRSAASD